MTSIALSDRNRQPELLVGELTETAREAIAYAYRHASLLRAERVQPEHLLLGVLSASGDLISQVLAALGIDPAQMSRSLEAGLSYGTTAGENPPRMSSEAQNVVQNAARETRLLRHARIDTVHLLLGLFYESDSPASAMLEAAGLSLFDLRQYILKQPKQWNIADEGDEYSNRRAVRRPNWESIASVARWLSAAMVGLLICWPLFFYWERWVADLRWYFWPVLAFLAFLISFDNQIR